MSETTIAGEKINDFFLEKGTEFSKNYGYVSIKISQNALIPYKKLTFFLGGTIPPQTTPSLGGNLIFLGNHRIG